MAQRRFFLLNGSFDELPELKIPWNICLIRHVSMFFNDVFFSLIFIGCANTSLLRKVDEQLLHSNSFYFLNGIFDVSYSYHFDKSTFHMFHMYMVLLLNAYFGEIWEQMIERNICRMWHTRMVFHQCESVHGILNHSCRGRCMYNYCIENLYFPLNGIFDVSWD